MNLGNEAVWPVVDALPARRVPLVLATGYDAQAIPPAYAGLPCCEKPASGEDLARVLARVLAAAPPTPTQGTRTGTAYTSNT